jgi:2'-5' RNA ligase
MAYFRRPVGSRRQAVAEQFSFLEPEPGPASFENNLFFALTPPPEMAARGVRLAERLRRGGLVSGRPKAAATLHVSLRGLGRFASLPDGLVARASAAAATVLFAPFEVRFDSVASFGAPDRRALVMRPSRGLAEIRALWQALGLALAKAGVKVGGDLEPHMTLLYDKRTIAEQAVEPVCWTVTDFVLIHSLIGQGRHLRLGRWPPA